MDHSRAHNYYPEDFTNHKRRALVSSDQNIGYNLAQFMSRGPSNDSGISSNTYSSGSTYSGEFSPVSQGFNFAMPELYNEYDNSPTTQYMGTDGYTEQDQYESYGYEQPYSPDQYTNSEQAFDNFAYDGDTYSPELPAMDVDYGSNMSVNMFEPQKNTADKPSSSRGSMMYNSVPENEPSTGGHTCLRGDCSSTTVFARKADLQRHYDQVHRPPHQKKQYFCDWSKCERHKSPFHRADHFRDHYRDFHKEDIPRKSGESQRWYEERAEKVSKKWWRCTKCLTKISIKDYAWTCIQCGSTCDTLRQNIRGYY